MSKTDDFTFANEISKRTMEYEASLKQISLLEKIAKQNEELLEVNRAILGSIIN